MTAHFILRYANKCTIFALFRTHRVSINDHHYKHYQLLTRDMSISLFVYVYHSHKHRHTVTDVHTLSLLFPVYSILSVTTVFSDIYLFFLFLISDLFIYVIFSCYSFYANTVYTYQTAGKCSVMNRVYVFFHVILSFLLYKPIDNSPSRAVPLKSR